MAPASRGYLVVLIPVVLANCIFTRALFAYIPCSLCGHYIILWSVWHPLSCSPSWKANSNVRDTPLPFSHASAWRHGRRQHHICYFSLCMVMSGCQQVQFQWRCLLPHTDHNLIGRYSIAATRFILVAGAFHCMQDFLFHTHKQVSPHLATARKHGIKTWAQSKKHGLKMWLAGKKHTNTFLSSPQVSILPTSRSLLHTQQ